MNKAEKLAAARKKLKEFQNQQRNKEIHGSSQTIQPQLPRSDIDSPSSRQEVETVTSIEDAAKLYSQNVHIPASSNMSNSFATQQPSLANYFQNSNRNEHFFDVVQNHVNGDTNNDPTLQTQANSSNLPASKPSSLSPAFSLFPAGLEDNSISTKFSPIQSTLDVRNENTNGDQMCISNDQELNSLKMEMQQAKSEIRMQKDALGIITAEKEDLQTKLIKAVQEIDLYERNVRLLNSQLEENISHLKQLEVTVEELKRFKENVSSREREFEQRFSDLKEKNGELCQNLEIEKENNKTLQSQLDETRSNYSLLTLKFQQLGIEVDNFHNKDYKSAHEECELWKHKYDELENRLRATLYEKDRTEEEYRQYVLNLKEELENANAELRRLSDENQTLTGKISSQTEHIGSLERQLQKTSGDASKDATIAELMEEVQKLRIEKKEDVETSERLESQLTENEALKRTVYELEGQIENLKADMTNAHELQMAVESNKVAASQAIAQNTKLKDEFEQLHQMVQILNEEKVMLLKMLEEEKTKNAALTVNSQNNEHESDNHQITTNDAAINTDAEEVGGENGAYGKANVEAMLLLQEKFKSVLDRMADLTDEKQQLEHLVMQLQSETETIEEYVALYQKQRSVLQQRARETDLKMENVSQEKERLLNILRLILTTDNFDSAFVKQLVENNLSVELSEELANRGSSVVDQHHNSLYLPKNDNISHHPSCPCCSGQLITI